MRNPFGTASDASPRTRKRYERAKGMFEFLVDREAWLGCRDWDGLVPSVQAAFIDMAALYTEPSKEG